MLPILRYARPVRVCRLRPIFKFPQYRPYTIDVKDLKHETDGEEDNSAETTGVLDFQQGKETVLYFDNIYPKSITRLSLIEPFSYLFEGDGHYNEEKVLEKIKSCIDPLPEGVEIAEFVPMVRDGGGFIKFTYPSDSSSKEVITHVRSHFTESIQKYSNPFLTATAWLFKAWPSVFQVKGVPWIEDMKRFPSPRVKVMFEGEPLTEEELYLLFRRYGQIVDIVPANASTKYATIDFQYIRSAVCAKNCITGLTLGEKSVLHLQYIPLKKVNYITDFIMNHQKISIPAILAIIATLAVLVFDPIRQWFIEEKISRKYSFDTLTHNQFVKIISNPFKFVSRWYYSAKSYVSDSWNDVCDEATGHEVDLNKINQDRIDILWSERFELIKQLKLWIHENVNTFIIVKGPKGSGKRDFVVEHTLQSDPILKKKILYINCEELVKSRTDNHLIQNTADQLGYFPVFTWTNSMSQFIDLGVQSITGQKSGLSESKETQIKNMFGLATVALKKVAFSGYENYQRDAVRAQRQAQQKGEEPASILKEDDYLLQHPEEKPIIVIDKFFGKSDSNYDFVYKTISEWSSQLVQSNLAHVVVITQDVGSVQHLTDALPNQVFKTISLSDASDKSSQQYVLNHLASDEKVNEASLSACLKPLGGRMLDLQAFIRRIKSGESPEDALKEMINQSAEQVTTFFLNSVNSDNNWSTAQIWAIMRLLAENDNVSFEKLTKSPLFKSSPETLATLSTLEKNDLISLKHDKGVLCTISTGRPLYKAAFLNLVNDANVFKVYETELYNSLIQVETNKIAKFEDEVSKISLLKDLSYLKDRLTYVSGKISASTDNIKGYEDKIKEIENLNTGKSFLGIKFS